MITLARFTDLTDSIHNELSGDMTDTDQNNIIKSNIKKGILELSKNFLENARSGRIKVEDTKDLKDIATVYQLLSGDGEDTSNTPGVNAEVVNFYSMQTGNGDPSDGAKPSNAGIIKGIEEMDENYLSELIASRDKNLDKYNESAWED